MMVQLVCFLIFLIASGVFVGCALPQKTAMLLDLYKEHELLQSHRFVPIEEGVLYSSREPDEDFLRWLLAEKKIKTFVSLKGMIGLEKVRMIQDSGATLIVFRWSARKVPLRDEIEKVLAIMNTQAKQPVHIFCKAGVDRTGFIRAYYRILHQGWSKKEAIQEFLGLGHFPNVLDQHLDAQFP